jgi:soluble lytic murein transglycosylase-like protein
MLPLFVSDISLHCINQIALEYHLPSKLLIAVLNVEGGKRGLIHHNTNGSDDLGEMQINTRWWPELYQYHITPQGVLENPCLNLRVGSWILARSIADGHNLLEGVGDYNSHTPVYNHIYTQKVREKYTVLQLQY